MQRRGTSTAVHGIVTTLIGIYRPPSILKTQWRPEILNPYISSTADQSDESAFLLGDFNCNLLRPDNIILGKSGIVNLHISDHCSYKNSAYFKTIFSLFYILFYTYLKPILSLFLLVNLSYFNTILSLF